MYKGYERAWNHDDLTCNFSTNSKSTARFKPFYKLVLSMAYFNPCSLELYSEIMQNFQRYIFLRSTKFIWGEFCRIMTTLYQSSSLIRQWASYQIRKIAGCACAGNAGNVFPCRRFQRKPLVSDPGMHHGTCVTHVPWCMSGSLTCGDRENVPGIPGACAPAILRIWQEAHGYKMF